MKKIIEIKAEGNFNLPIKPVNTQAPLTGEETVSGLKNPPPLALYIHIPWCVKKCPYCDFNSHEARPQNKDEGIPEKRYVDALIADLEMSVPRVYGRKIKSVFFGGGTPSLFSAESIDKILSAVRMLTPLEYEAEVTLEANPGTVDTANFSGYKAAGVNRLSLGIQSFNANYLNALGRIHNDKQAILAAELALKTFERVNLDLMYGLPNQSLEKAMQDVQQAVALGSDHLSFYHLTLEPNTPFYRSPPSLPDDDITAEMQEHIERYLAEHGYQHYETSAFCKPKKEARHNLNYWQFGDYLGIGAGAHSKLSYHDKITRETRHKHPKSFMDAAESGDATDQIWQIERTDLSFEFMMNALRLMNGFDSSLFYQRTGLPVQIISKELELAASKGLILQTPFDIKPTLLGQRYLNDLLAIFLND